jgi:hypothetical protein
MQPPCEFFRGANPLRHKPGTDNISILDFNSVTAQHRTSIFAYLTDLLQQACHDGHVKGPEDNQSAVFQGSNVEVSDGQLVNQGLLLYGLLPAIARRIALASSEMFRLVVGAC